MSKIIFNSDPSNIYEGQFSQIGNNQIRLVMDSLPSESILLSGFVLVNEHNGRVQTNRKDYIYIYKTYEDGKTIELCNDDVQWTKPKMKVKFTASYGGKLDGELEQYVNNYEELTIPTPIANENYEFVKWNHEIPSSGEVEKNTNFVAIFAYMTTLEEIKAMKIQEFSYICNQTIDAGQDLTLSDGKVVHFKYTQYDQMNMKTAADLAIATNEAVPFYDGQNKCSIYSPMDMVNIYVSCQSYVTYMLTLDHQLEEMIESMDDKDAIANLTFSVDSLDAENKADFDSILLQAQKVSEKYISSITNMINE